MEFDLELAKQGHPVRTINSENVRIICFDGIGNFPIIVLIKHESANFEQVNLFTNEGKFFTFNQHCFDLEMVPIEKEYFVNIYQTFSGILFAGNIFSSEYLAKESLRNNSEKFIKTISFKI